MELTQQQAREELGKLEMSELIKLAEEQGKPTAGFDKNGLIELLLGNCVGCKKGSITVVIISSRTRKQFVQNKTKDGKPCVGCK
jgi:hypothetical protein